MLEEGKTEDSIRDLKLFWNRTEALEIRGVDIKWVEQVVKNFSLGNKLFPLKAP